ncbi:MAG: hypothetical protein ACM37W_25970 [Actinomycetota bacterium]
MGLSLDYFAERFRYYWLHIGLEGLRSLANAGFWQLYGSLLGARQV